MKNQKQKSHKHKGSGKSVPSKKQIIAKSKQYTQKIKDNQKQPRRLESQDAPAPHRHKASNQQDDQPSTSGRPQSMSLKALGKMGRGKKGGSIIDKFKQNLPGGHFRHLNQELYEKTSDDAWTMLEKDPSLYEKYHQGFREQAKGWPQQPVDLAIRWLSKKPSKWVVADLGCGDAQLAASVQQKVKSFDLVAGAPGVIACNMAHLPLDDASVDVAVFSLSLMGTDYGSFLEEAARVLKPNGWIWVAEVQSRFMDTEGKSMLDDFIRAVSSLGFSLKHKDLKNPFFLLLEFQGAADREVDTRSQTEWPVLKACMYKKR